MANIPQSVIMPVLIKLSHASRPSVRGSDNKKLAIEKISSSITAHNPLSDKVERACCPESTKEPYQERDVSGEQRCCLEGKLTVAKIANMIDPNDRISRPIGPNMM